MNTENQTFTEVYEKPTPFLRAQVKMMFCDEQDVSLYPQISTKFAGKRPSCLFAKGGKNFGTQFFYYNF